jgi:sarcosine oxidase subunit beta
VSEPLKPIMPCVVMSNTIHAYMSQSDKGELVIGAGTDAYTPIARPAACISPPIRWRRSASCSRCSRMRMLRNWGGIVDVTPDRSPIIGKTPVPGLLCQLRLGHRRLQGDAGLGPCLRPYGRDRRAASDQRALHARPLPHRPLIDEAAAAAVAH